MSVWSAVDLYNQWWVCSCWGRETGIVWCDYDCMSNASRILPLSPWKRDVLCWRKYRWVYEYRGRLFKECPCKLLDICGVDRSRGVGTAGDQCEFCVGNSADGRNVDEMYWNLEYLA